MGDRTKLCDYTNTPNDQFIAKPITTPKIEVDSSRVSYDLLHLITKKQFGDKRKEDCLDHLNNFVSICSALNVKREAQEVMDQLEAAREALEEETASKRQEVAALKQNFITHSKTVESSLKGILDIYNPKHTCTHVIWHPLDFGGVPMLPSTSPAAPPNSGRRPAAPPRSQGV